MKSSPSRRSELELRDGLVSPLVQEKPSLHPPDKSPNIAHALRPHDHEEQTLIHGRTTQHTPCLTCHIFPSWCRCCYLSWRTSSWTIQMIFGRNLRDVPGRNLISSNAAPSALTRCLLNVTPSTRSAIRFRSVSSLSASTSTRRTCIVSGMICLSSILSRFACLTLIVPQFVRRKWISNTIKLQYCVRHKHKH